MKTTNVFLGALVVTLLSSVGWLAHGWGLAGTGYYLGILEDGYLCAMSQGTNILCPLWHQAMADPETAWQIHRIGGIAVASSLVGIMVAGLYFFISKGRENGDF
ncbi:MAG: hypothetical protein KGI81_00300 [Betaproteobacteria bacterium]|nr:hypothetical protein [Betaproteobacteria bacterium]